MDNRGSGMDNSMLSGNGRVSSSMLNLGSGDLRGVHRGGGRVNGKIGSGHPESSSVGNILNRLDVSVAVHVVVGPLHHTVRGLGLVSVGAGVVVAEAVLAQLVLGVILAEDGVNGGCYSNGSSMGNNRRGSLGNGNRRG